MRQAFAETLLSSLQNEPALRNFVYNKIQKADTSNYELIYLAEKDEVISNGNTFADIMNSYASSQVVSQYGSNYFSNTITDDQPLLSISMSNFDGLDISNWKVDSIPDVVALSTTVDNQFTKYSIYNTAPQLFNVTQSTNPTSIITRYTLVVKNAEIYYLFNSSGVSIKGNNIAQYIPSSGQAIKDAADRQNLINEINPANFTSYTINNSTYYLINHNDLLQKFSNILGPNPYYGFVDLNCVHCPRPPVDTVVIRDCVKPCERDCEDEDEHLVKFKINGWGVYKTIDNQGPWGWFERYFVFRAQFLLGVNNNGEPFGFSPKLVTRSYKKDDLLDCDPDPCRGRDLYVNYRIWTDWDKNELGDPYAVQWYEYDQGSTTVGFTIPLEVTFGTDSFKVTTGVDFSYSITGDKIVDLGNQRVFYCDDIMKANDTGSITFYCD